MTDGALAGTWTTNLNLFPDGEDWSTVRITLSAENGIVSGEMLPLAGTRHPITGRTENGVGVLMIVDAPSVAGPCSPQIVVTAVETVSGHPRALLGRLGGRCPNTLMRDLRLNRV